MAQAGFLVLDEIDLDLGSSGRGLDCGGGVQFEIIDEQMSVFEGLQIRRNDHHNAGVAGVPLVDAVQEHFGVVDIDPSFLPRDQHMVGKFAQPPGELVDQLIDPAFLPEYFWVCPTNLT